MSTGGWTPQMKRELQTIFDSTVKKAGYATRQEILRIAKLVHEDPDELEDQLDVLDFDEDNLLDWDEFFDWWSEEVDPRDYL